MSGSTVDRERGLRLGFALLRVGALAEGGLGGAFGVLFWCRAVVGAGRQRLTVVLGDLSQEFEVCQRILIGQIELHGLLV